MKRILIALVLLLFLVHPGVTAGAEEVGEPEIQLFVLEDGCRSASVSADRPHRWLIRCTLPAVTGCCYTVTQTLSPGLALEPESLTVRLPDGEALVMETHFQFTAGTVTVEQGQADRFSIELTEEGNALFSDGGELEITYEARIRRDAPLGTQLLGTAQLRCRDREGSGALYTSEKAAVSTGGFPIFLTTATGEPVPGGKFMLAREATPEEQRDSKTVTELLDNGTDILSVVYVPFRNAQGEKTYTAETDREGNAICCGLAYGSYYLVQTELPEGWGLPAKPIPVCVNEVSHLTLRDGWQAPDGTMVDHTVRVVLQQLLLPESGGPGTELFTCSGIIVVLSACLLLWFNRKRGIYG